LHDIGKAAIPDHVLLKPGKLTDLEFEIMKTHTTLGAKTLEAVLKKHPQAGFLHMASEIAMTHHERFDGTGYPNKLKGRDIPLCGRIMAVADVYDALTTRRVYKPAMDHQAARDIICKGSGSHFDPDLVAAFLRQEPQFIAIRDTYQDVLQEAA
jgi:putative two-component system response regulator